MTWSSRQYSLCLEKLNATSKIRFNFWLRALKIFIIFSLRIYWPLCSRITYIPTVIIQQHVFDASWVLRICTLLFLQTRFLKLERKLKLVKMDLQTGNCSFWVNSAKICWKRLVIGSKQVYSKTNKEIHIKFDYKKYPILLKTHHKSFSDVT